ncbi:uroporphyrinogen-III C-methyltransferase [Coniochaeta ligniaria NRRL 30616]|uniref:Uroporphyrinogen-III C-methyltransferase n=1 Tax=Coniochaeta ligniaria NRRL 30616 TaxID=1408157 RepID=A0A1J7JPD4_9PEZI|nr:uroporphyrinogen-III C-methyltransferase [Coniochaeta ligniaria NRRL 30616]
MTTSDCSPPSAPSPSQPTYHTSLLTAVDSRNHIHLILGANSLAATRTAQSLAAGAKPLLIAPPPPQDSPLHYSLQKHIDAGSLAWLPRSFADEDILTLGREEIGHVVDAVFVTCTADAGFSRRVSALCKRHRVPVNVVDSPALCTFTLLSTHVDGPLQIGVTTNGRGCKLASRIRREVAAALPPGLGDACARLGDVRRRIQDEDRLARHGGAGEKPVEADGGDLADEGVDDSLDQTATFNKLVTDADLDAAKTRRMRWLSQVCEYWPLKRLAAVSDADVDAILQSYHNTTDAQASSSPLHSDGRASPSPKLGRIILAGSGPGHPDLLTRATHKAILAADVILADKLVPAGVLDLIPRRTTVHIARKFPGNADRAQEELLSQALGAVREGKTVLRLKQGDPFVYGRGGEEVEFFRQEGLGERVVVLPGVTSALSAPLFAGVPVTQRDVADQVLVCTGTGKKGVAPAPPEWVESRTVVFLMALHRIGGLVGELTRRLVEGAGEKEEGRRLWPLDTPCAVVERASCPDQRVIRTTLRYVEEAIEQEGSRPPGLLVVGRACEALYTPEKGRSWVVEDGFRGLDLDDFVAPGIAAME